VASYIGLDGTYYEPKGYSLTVDEQGNALMNLSYYHGMNWIDRGTCLVVLEQLFLEY